MSYNKTIYKNKPAKLEIFNKSHKLFKSLPTHRKALELGLYLPKIYGVEEKSGNIYKFTEWIEGNTIHDEMEKNPDMIESICMDLAKYVSELRDVGKMSPVDNHFKNFVWYNGSVIYIDMKKLFYETYEEHVMRMSKLCLKNCRGKYKRRKILAFLKEYSKYGDVESVLFDCNKRGWMWGAEKIDPISYKEFKK